MKLIVCALSLMVLLVGNATLSAQEKKLSPAEIAAQKSRPAVNTEDIVRLCNHTLLYAAQAEKDKLIAKLGDKTCEQAVSESFSIR